LQLVTTIERPDVMIVDFVNPEVDAHELLEKARIRFGKSTMPPVLFLRDTPEDEEAANDLFADDVLLKPIEPALLLESVNKLIVKPQPDED
jgi:DNA-binding response OmpR family regulator